MPKVVRVGQHKDFTIIENDCLRDMALDIAERGLLVTMLSLPDNWDFSGIGLTSILPCGKTKVFNSLKRLEKAGYLKRQRVYENGKVVDWVYYICGRPVFKDENNGNHDNSKETVDNSVGSTADNSENSSLHSDNLVLENLVPENQEVGFQDIENREDNKIYNNKLYKDVLYNNQSIYQSNSGKVEIEGLNDINITSEDYNAYKELIRKNIEYDIISQRYYDKRQLDEIVNIMAETVAFNRNPIRINGSDMPADIVKSRFLKIGSQDIEYILETLSKNTAKVYNIRAYLITTIYNAKDTINSYYKSEVQHDMFG